MFRKLLALSVLFMLPACAEVELASHVAKQIPITQEKQQSGTFKVGTPYRIAGRQYLPSEAYKFTETGIASWYGPNFHGKQTANGEIFDKYALTAAHRTLQMPSIARVTNLENGRSIIVRINDRGPFSKNRVMDLSERSAELLDFKNQGTARVRIDVLENESRKVASLAKQGYGTQGYETALNRGAQKQLQLAYNTRPATMPVTPTAKPSFQPPPVNTQTLTTAAARAQNGFYVQAGSFGDQANAMALAQKLQPYGIANVSPTSVNGSKFYRVRFGPFQRRPDVDSLVASLSDANISAPIVIVE